MGKAHTTEFELTPEVIDASLELVVLTFRELTGYVKNNAGNNTDAVVKGDGSPVTEIDIEVEHRIIEAMKKKHPEIIVFGEESGYSDPLPDTFVTIDPIDGTSDYINGGDSYTGMVSIIHEGVVVAAGIYNYSSGDTYTARRGQGAYKNGQKIDLNLVEQPSRTLLCKGALVEEFNEALAPYDITCEKAPSPGGFGFTMILDGKAGGRAQIKAGGNIHDYAPGGLLVEEAGGVNIAYDDNPYSFASTKFIACNRAIAPGIDATIALFRAADAA